MLLLTSVLADEAINYETFKLELWHVVRSEQADEIIISDFLRPLSLDHWKIELWSKGRKLPVFSVQCWE